VTAAKLGPKDVDVASYGGLTDIDLKVIQKGCNPTLKLQVQRAANRLNWALALSSNKQTWTERYKNFLLNEQFVTREAGFVDNNGRLWTKYEVMTAQEKNLFDSLEHFAEIMDLAAAESEQTKRNSSSGGRPPTKQDWAAAGSVDTNLSFLSFLELYGTEIAERRMPARRVVEAFDVIEHV
jgi:hypothetical protein